MPSVPILSALRQSFFLPAPTLTEHNIGDLSGRTVLITGGNSGVGRQLCTILYGANATVYLAGRNETACKEAVASIQTEYPNARGSITWLKLDLSDLASISDTVKEFLEKADRLDYLANNAGVMAPPKGSKGKQGHELQHATNCIGAYILTESLRPLLVKTAKENKTKGFEDSVRVSWAGSIGIDLNSFEGGAEFVKGENGLEEPKLVGEPMRDYMVTKTGDLFLAKAWGDEVKNDGIVSVCFNPGNLWTGLQRHSRVGIMDWLWVNIFSNFLHHARFGAYTELYCGFSPDLTTADQGAFIAPWGRKWSVRADIEKAKNGEICTRYVDWVRREAKPYITYGPQSDPTPTVGAASAPAPGVVPQLDSQAPTSGGDGLFA